jgi:ubiquinone/menaquinone biosynthesis C-methylase UbiE
MPLATEREIQDYYADRDVAARYVRERFVSELHRLLHDRQVAAVQRLIDRHRPARVLEVAPGPGRVTRDVRPTGRRVCLEFNAGMIEQGRRACDPATCLWVRGNSFRLPFGEAFDLAYTFRFLRHFRRGDRSRLYAELRRVLRPGGWLAFDAVNDLERLPRRDGLEWIVTCRRA